MEPPAQRHAPTLFHVTHWKAGSQWIMKILRELAPDRIVAPRTGEGQFLFDPLVPGGVYPTVYVTKEQFDSVRLPQHWHRFVVLRELRDTLVSAYFSFRYSHGLISRGLADLHGRLESLNTEDGLLYLLEKWLPGVASIHASWIGAGEPIVRYEDLLERDVELLEAALLQRGGMDIDPATFRRVVEANRFAVLSGGRAAGQEDALAHARKGVAGDWKNHFTPRVARRFEELFGALERAGSTAHSSSVTAGGTRPSGVVTGESDRHGAPPSGAVRLMPEQILAGYDVLAARTPNVPIYNLWLACEHAAVRQFPVGGRVLDLGCSDPSFFRLNCPQAAEAIGVGTNATFVEWAQQSGLYADVKRVDDFEHLGQTAAFDHVFTRTTLSQVPKVAPVLREIARCLRPGGTLVCTALTQRYRDWALLPRLLEAVGQAKVAERTQREHLHYHAISHCLPPRQWREHFAAAGLEVAAEVPFLPRFTAHLFLLFDMLWHRSSSGGELGDQITAYLSSRPHLRGGIRGVFAAMLELDTEWDDTAAIVYALRRPS